MRSKFILGLTGGIASGKSAVLALFKKEGARTLDCDKIAREVVRPGSPALKKIVRAFGPSVLGRDGALDRKMMADIVFASAARRRKLEAIVHPEVVRRLRKGIAAVPSGLVVADIPLLFEAGLGRLADAVAVVWVPRALQFRRLRQRDGFGVREAARRLRSQWPLDKKKKLAGIVIDNSGPLAATRRQVRQWARRLKNPQKLKSGS